MKNKSIQWVLFASLALDLAILGSIVVTLASTWI